MSALIRLCSTLEKGGFWFFLRFWHNHELKILNFGFKILGKACHIDVHDKLGWHHIKYTSNWEAKMCQTNTIRRKRFWGQRYFEDNSLNLAQEAFWNIGCN